MSESSSPIRLFQVADKNPSFDPATARVGSLDQSPDGTFFVVGYPKEDWVAAYWLSGHVSLPSPLMVTGPRWGYSVCVVSANEFYVGGPGKGSLLPSPGVGRYWRSNFFDAFQMEFINPPAGSEYHEFGSSLACVPSYLMVGSPAATTNDEPVASLFERQSSILFPNVWILPRTIEMPPRWGSVLAVSGNARYVAVSTTDSLLGGQLTVLQRDLYDFNTIPVFRPAVAQPVDLMYGHSVAISYDGAVMLVGSRSHVYYYYLNRLTDEYIETRVESWSEPADTVLSLVSVSLARHGALAVISHKLVSRAGQWGHRLHLHLAQNISVDWSLYRNVRLYERESPSEFFPQVSLSADGASLVWSESPLDSLVRQCLLTNVTTKCVGPSTSDDDMTSSSLASPSPSSTSSSITSSPLGSASFTEFSSLSLSLGTPDAAWPPLLIMFAAGGGAVVLVLVLSIVALALITRNKRRRRQNASHNSIPSRGGVANRSRSGTSAASRRSRSHTGTSLRRKPSAKQIRPENVYGQMVAAKHYGSGAGNTSNSISMNTVYTRPAPGSGSGDDYTRPPAYTQKPQQQAYESPSALLNPPAVFGDYSSDFLKS